MLCPANRDKRKPNGAFYNVKRDPPDSLIGLNQPELINIIVLGQWR